MSRSSAGFATAVAGAPTAATATPTTHAAAPNGGLRVRALRHRRHTLLAYAEIHPDETAATCTPRTSRTSSHIDAVFARAHGTALTDAFTAAARGGDLELVLACADKILAEGFYIGTRGELIAGMLYRPQLNDYETGTSTGDYFGLSKRWVEKEICTAADMKFATCGGILMRGLARGWLESKLYDQLANASRGFPDWERAMSMIARGNPGPFRKHGWGRSLKVWRARLSGIRLDDGFVQGHRAAGAAI